VSVTSEPSTSERYLFQSAQEFSPRLIGVLVNRMDFVAGLKVSYVVSEAFSYRDPLRPQIIKDIYGCSCKLRAEAPLYRAVTTN
jgi:hypothetical protein